MQDWMWWIALWVFATFLWDDMNPHWGLGLCTWVGFCSCVVLIPFSYIATAELGIY